MGLLDNFFWVTKDFFSASNQVFVQIPLIVDVFVKIWAVWAKKIHAKRANLSSSKSTGNWEVYFRFGFDTSLFNHIHLITYSNLHSPTMLILTSEAIREVSSRSIAVEFWELPYYLESHKTGRASYFLASIWPLGWPQMPKLKRLKLNLGQTRWIQLKSSVSKQILGKSCWCVSKNTVQCSEWILFGCRHGFA